MSAGPLTPSVRHATADELPTVMNVIDGGFLAIDAETVRKRIAATDVLVAVAASRVLGTLVLDGNEIEVVAVRRGRQGLGVGSALIEAASDRRDRLTASFRPEVRPFYESLGFDVERTSEKRCRGVR